MVEVRGNVRFLLNDREITLDSIRPDTTLLDFLRLDQRLTGSKEGCAEGDCGACTVLVGRLRGENLDYETVTACIRFVGSLDGCHVVTIEHLRGADGGLHPVQQAMVEHHGSQCGFCTPGIVMSLYGLWMQSPDPSRAEIERWLQGNLCRCTGYAPIIKAAQTVSSYGALESDYLVAERASVVAALKVMRDGARVVVESAGGTLVVPANADDLGDVLNDMPDARIVAGSTDVGLWVTKFMRDISPTVFIGNLEDLKSITVEDDALVLGAGVSYTEALPAIREHFPQMAEFWLRIGGEQVRNMGTVGGNIANGSPIGDTPPPLIALGAEIVLRQGGDRREMPLEEFFIAYGKQDRKPGEFVESVHIPFAADGDIFAVHKVSKRRDEDISALCGSFLIKVTDGVVGDARIAFGGMAATPKRASSVEGALTGKPWTVETVTAAMAAFDTDYQPISDMRASAEYRLMAARNLLMRVYLESQGEDMRLREVPA